MTLSGEHVKILQQNGLAFLADENAQQNADTDAMWLIVASVLVFMMQYGFAMLCAGLVR
jgi:hypothetical protein